jgi:uncharacterized protein
MGLIGRKYTTKYIPNKPLQYVLDPRDPLQIDFRRKEHIFVSAKSGSGKSYGAGVLVEEIIRELENYAVTIIDPMGIHNTYDTPNRGSEVKDWNDQIYNRQDGRPEIIPQGLTKFKVWIPAGDVKEFETDAYHQVFSLRPIDITPDILCYTFDMEILDPMMNLFRRSRAHTIQEYGENFELGELFADIKDNGKDSYGFKDQTIDALLSRLHALRELGIISNTGIGIHEVVQEGEVNVIDISMSSTFTGRIIVNFFAEKLLNLRKKITRKLAQAEKKSQMIHIDNYIPPTLLFLEEAHNYFQTSTQSNAILTKFIKEGRSVGCMLAAISQSPDLSKNVFANITHLFVGQMTFDDDIMGIKAMLPIEKKPAEFREQIKSLGIGCFYYYNMNTKEEKRIMFRPRLTMHPAKTELSNERKFLLTKDNVNGSKLLDLLVKTPKLAINDLPQELRSCVKGLVAQDQIKLVNENDQTMVTLA